MPTVPSPHKQAALAAARRSTSPLPPQPPPKAIDLNSSTRSTDRETGAKITRRAFLCDLVVERDGEETSNLLPYLGQPLEPISLLAGPSSQPVTPSRRALPPADDSPAPAWSKEKQVEMETRLKGLIEELVRTERSYLSRIEALKKAYADPLRNFARQEYSKIIPMYEAKTLFTNIDSIITASTVFSKDLEEMFASGQGAERVGTVCLRHLKDLKTFEPYRSYLSKQDESQKMFHEVMKRYSSFGSFIERTKYQTTGIGNIGLRELLMEPVQRIPRYTLLWQTMVKCLPTLSEQRPQLMESIEIASRIAWCEPDPQTIRATVMYCLERNVDGFPANLISNNRDYLDSIDVEDIPTEAQPVSPDSRRLSNITSPSASTPSLASMGSGSSSAHLPMSPNGGPSVPHLPCTLFLFDDKLMIVKRQSSAISGRKITGLDDMQALVRSGGGVAVLDKQSAKKDKLSFRGLVDVSDVIAVDVGNGDFQLYLENPPNELGERWSGRPFRLFSTVQPPFGVGLDPVASRQDKLRFLDNLWSAQARARSKILPTDLGARAPSQVLASKGETGLDNAGEPFSRARLYWNVWKRRDWIAAKKARVVVHIDEEGESADLPLSSELDPSLAIRLQPLAGGLCRMSYTTADEEETERLLVSMQDVVQHMITIIHQFGAFKIRASSTSAPTTPGGTQRFRPSLLNLDTLSRNLFGNSISARSHSSTSDNFGSNSTKRSKSGMSRSSTQSSNARRHSTSLGSALGHDSMRLERIPSAQSESEEMPMAPYRHDPAMGQSEIDLNERLNLARKNSKSIAALSPGPSLRLGAKSVGEFRNQQNKSADLRRRHSNVEQAIEAEAALRDAMRAGSPSPLSPTSGPQTPLSPTAPLRIRKTPSPSKGMTPDDTPKAKGIGIGLYDSTPTLDAMIAATAMSAPPTLDIPSQHLRSPASHEIMVPTSAHLRSPVSHEPIKSPPLDRMSSPPPRPTSAPIPSSPRPLGPRSPTLRGTPVYPGLGSGHTSLRVVSGNGRKITPGRATMPLRDDSPRGREISGTSVKRQHSADQLSPRKRSPSRSPLDRSEDVPDKMPDPLPVPMLTPKKSSTRKTPTRTESRRSSGPLTPMRRVSSAGSNSVTSQTTSAKAESKADHPHAPAAIDSTRHNIHEARAASKKLRSEIHALRKMLRHDSATPLPSWVTDKNGSLPRSPHRRNIQRLADKSHGVDGENLPPEINRHDLDELAQSISTIAHRLEDVLKIAASDGDQASVLVGRLLHDNTQMFRDIEGLRAQVMRKKEAHDQLKTQLADVQVEVDVIYEAFNTELDGMFNDVSLPPTEAFEAMRLDLQDTKARRNELALENMKLKRELEEAKLKRDQWARMLKQQGVLP